MWSDAGFRLVPKPFNLHDWLTEPQKCVPEGQGSIVTPTSPIMTPVFPIVGVPELPTNCSSLQPSVHTIALLGHCDYWSLFGVRGSGLRG